MQNDTCYILALIKRDDGERLLLGSGFYEFTAGQKHFNPNVFANDVVELQGTDGQLLAGQVRRSTTQIFEGYIGDGTTIKTLVEQKRREFFLFFRKQHHYTVVYIMPDGTAIKRDRGYITEAPAVQELYQFQPKWRIGMAFEDVNYYSYAEDSQGNEIYSFEAELGLANIADGGLVWDANGAISSKAGFKLEKINGDTFQQSYSGINIFSSSLEAGYYDSDGTKQEPSSGGARSVAPSAVSASTQYIMSNNGSAWTGGVRVFFYNSNNVFIESASTATGIFTTPANCAWINFHSSALGPIRPTAKIQIEAGSTASTYQPYVGGTKSPNPDFPQTIQTVTGEQTITIDGTDYPLDLGKNLLNASLGFQYGYIDKSGAYIANGTIVLFNQYIEVSPGADYRFSSSHTNNNMTAVFYDSSKTFISRTLVNDTAVNSFKTPTDCRYVRLQANYDGSNMSQAIVDSMDVMLTAGSTATTYAPYKTPVELCKLGTFQDYIWKDGDDWKIHKATKKTTLTGTEQWGSTGTGNHSCYTTAITGYATSNNVPFSPYFSGVDNVNGAGTMNSKPDNSIAFIDQSATVRFYIRSSKFENNAPALKTWLSTHNTDVYFALATATDTAITDADLIAQLEAIAEAMGTDGKPTAIVPTGQNLAAIITSELNGTGGYIWAASSGGGPINVTVNGVDSANPVWHVYGPATNPTLTNSTTGEALTWNGTIPSQQELIIDMGAQTATLEGANVFEFVSGSWVQLEPGTNRISYTAANTTKPSKVYWNEVVG